MRHRAPGPLWRFLRSLSWRVTRVPVAGALAAVLVLAAGLTVMTSGFGGDAESAPGDAVADAARAGTPKAGAVDRSPLPLPSRSGTRREGARSTTPSPSTSSSTPTPAPPPTPTPTQTQTPTPIPTETPRVDRTPRTPAPSEESPTREPVPDAGSSTPQASAPSAAPDETAPQTQIESGPTDGLTSPLVFTANEPSTFKCSLDGAVFVPCASPIEYAGLRAGWHTLEVAATDRAGNVDPTPAMWRWHMTAADE